MQQRHHPHFRQQRSVDPQGFADPPAPERPHAHRTGCQLAAVVPIAAILQLLGQPLVRVLGVAQLLDPPVTLRPTSGQCFEALAACPRRRQQPPDIVLRLRLVAAVSFLALAHRRLLLARLRSDRHRRPSLGPAVKLRKAVINLDCRPTWRLAIQRLWSGQSIYRG
jgi:hypothetical protein